MLKNLSLPGTGRENLPQESEKSNVQKALDDRLSFSEVTEIAGILLDQFPNSKNSADGFIGSIAAILEKYPRQTALKTIDPLNGVARDNDFLTISTLIGWCERETEPLRRQVAYESRVKEQLRARDEWQNYKPSDRLMEMGKSWINRTDPVARDLVGETQKKTTNPELLEKIAEANRSIFERECAAAGIGPNSTVSPSLLKLLKEQAKTE